MIDHSVSESIEYLLRSSLQALNNRAVIEAFERKFAEYCGRRYCVAFPFARTAIYFTLKHLHLPKGSEIILPPITVKGIVDVVLALGLKPIYVDFDFDTLCFRLDALKQAVGPNTKAAVLTPLFGLVPDMRRLVDFFRERKIFVLEDFSQCLNGEYDGQRVGTFGEAAVYSSSSIKTLDTLGGGLAITDDKTLYAAWKEAQSSLSPPSRAFLLRKAWVNLIRNVATTRLVFSALTFPLLQLMRLWNPGRTLKHTGTRSTARLTALPRLWFRAYSSVQARIGLAQLADVASEDRQRIEHAEQVKMQSDRTRFPATTERSRNVYWQLLMRSEDAVQAQAALAAHGIDSSTTSLELVSALDDYPNQPMPMATQIHTNGLFLPCFSRLSRRDVERVIEAARHTR